MFPVLLLLLCFLAPVTECLAQTANDDRASQDIRGWKRYSRYTVQVQVKGKYRCMAGMISTEAALVRKSCVKDEEKYTIVAGDRDRFSIECWVESRDVTDIIKHSTEDLAILKFKSIPVTREGYIRPVELAPAGAKLNASDRTEWCTIVSWGKHNATSTELSRISLMGFLQPAPMSTCTQKFGKDTDTSAFCLTGHLCDGDEGAMLKCSVKGVDYTAFGLISKVTETCDLHGAVLATPITKKDTSKWIADNIK